jgi:hypothetical protein
MGECPEKLQSGDWLVYNDSVPAHTALSVQHVMAKNKMNAILHCLCYQDFAPFSFLFPKMKLKHKGKRFNNVLEI